MQEVKHFQRKIKNKKKKPQEIPVGLLEKAPLGQLRLELIKNLPRHKAFIYFQVIFSIISEQKKDFQNTDIYLRM